MVFLLLFVFLVFLVIVIKLVVLVFVGFVELELLLVVVVEFLQCFDIVFENVGGVWKSCYGVVDVGFVEQMQGWIWCVVGEIVDIVGVVVGEFVLWMQVGDLENVVEVEVVDYCVGFGEKEVEVEEIVYYCWMDEQCCIECLGIGVGQQLQFVFQFGQQFIGCCGGGDGIVDLFFDVY